MPLRAANDRLVPRVVGRPTGPPPSGGGQPPGDGTISGGTGGVGGGGLQPSERGGGRTIGDSMAQLRGQTAKNVGQQTAQQNVGGATPFMQTPGMQISSQRISGDQVENDPAVSAALANFARNVQPQIQNRATLSGLGRSTAALNAVSNAQGQMLAPMYEAAFGREGDRLNRMGAAAENELGRRERSAARVADANQNQANLLMQLSNTMYGRQQGTGQNLMSAGGTLRDYTQQGNAAQLNEFLRQQALAEQAVYAPFGGLASAGMGSTSSTTGK